MSSAPVSGAAQVQVGQSRADGTSRSAEIRILTNHPGRVASPSWRRVATYLKAGGTLWSDISVAASLLARRRSHDCVVLGAGRSDLIYAMVQSLLPLKRKPTVMVDCLWYEGDTWLAHTVRRGLKKLADKSIDKYCVWASRETADYARAFGLPERKFVFVPYHTTLEGLDVRLRDEGYLFAGGNFARDYPTLIDAVRDLPVTLHIASNRPELFTNIDIPSNVIVKGYSHLDYLNMMAGCAINIVPLAAGLLHSGGQQTFLNSMWMGKPTIVTDPAGARDYIQHGVDGMLVPPGDSAALRQAITVLLGDARRAREMGERARAKVVSGYSTEDHFRRVIALAADVVAGQKEMV
jgi:glycosyltransferase involved in cell wall biosynthesis